MKIKMIIKMKMKMINDNGNENRVVQILRLLGQFVCFFYEEILNVKHSNKSI